MDLVFHGGSGSLLSEIRESLDYGVIKMNIDTDTQYAFTRPVVDHMLKNYDGVLKIDGEVGKKADFILLDKDLMKVPTDSILQIKVLKTYSNGVRVH